MSPSSDRLYELLPAIYRLRDADQGYPLKALLQVIAEQVDVVQDDIAQLYENWFIETCQDWVVPYIGELVGYLPVNEAGEPGGVATPRASARERILIPRREVANTIRARRRKGTLALLDLLANDVAGWPARVVEFYRLLDWTQNVNYLHLKRGLTANLCDSNALDLISTPFDPFSRTVEVRRIASPRTQGRYNIPSVGVFVWRLKSYSVTQTPAYCLEDVGPQCFTFSVLGNDTPLYNRPHHEDEPNEIPDELDLPTPIRRHGFEERILTPGQPPRGQASDKYYEVGKSLTIWAPDFPKKGMGQPIPCESTIPADLSDWQYRAPRNFIAVDPELGRIVFPATQLPKQGVWVSYQYAFSADIGGGEYDRPITQPEDAKIYRVGRHGDFSTIKAALDQWAKENPKPLSAVIELTDSGVYTEQLILTLQKDECLQIRAANRTRPVIRLLDYLADRPDAFSATGAAGSRFTLDGLLITGRGLQVYGPEPNGDGAGDGDLCDVTIRHCTLVPGWGLHNDCEPKRPSEPSLELVNTSARFNVEHSIIGFIQVIADEVKRDPVQLSITDSILDATSVERVALGAANLPLAYAVLNIARSTVIGQIQTHAIELAENCIFDGLVRVARRQQGCVRFSYVPPGSRTPRRFNCQPDLVEQAVAAKCPPGQDCEPDKARERMRVEPQFNSTRYGTPTYCQLGDACADEIKHGADDESEMGVFHDLYQPQREANLRTRLDEYTPAGMEAGIIYAS